MNRYFKRSGLILSSLFIACAGGQSAVVPSVTAVVATLDPLQGGEIVLQAGDADLLAERLRASLADQTTQTFLQAEIDLLDGRFTRAYERFVAVSSAEPNHLLGTVAMHHAARLDGNVTATRERLEPLFEATSGIQLEPSAAVAYNTLEMQAAFDAHRHAGLSPVGRFSGAHLGIPDVWRSVGPMSFRRFLHFDRHEAPDDDEVLADRYSLRGRSVETQLIPPMRPILRMYS